MKKILSLILVLAMLLGMTSLQVFADGEVYEITGNHYVLVGKYITLSGKKATGAEVPEGADPKWASNDETVATVSTSGTVTGVKAGEANITYSDDDPKADSIPFKLTVLDGSLSLKAKDDDKTTSVSVQEKTDLDVIAKVGENDLTSDQLGEAELTATSSNSSVVKVVKCDAEKKIIEVQGLKKGSATITATLKFAGGSEKTTFTVKVEGFDFEDKVENGSKITYTASELCKELASAINGDITEADIDYDDISEVTFEKQSGTSDYGTLTSSQAATKGIAFEAKAGCIGNMVYDVAVKANGATYKGTWTVTVEAAGEIDEDYEAKFAKEAFLIDFPSGIDYLEEVSSDSAFEGSYKYSDPEMYDEDHFIVDPTKLTASSTTGKATMYVVGLDDDGLAYTGTIVFEKASYDFSYAGKKDVEVAVDADDFEDLFSAIADDQGDNTYDLTKDYYTELDSVTFTLSSKEYTIENDGTALTSSKRTVKAEDLDDVTITPLKSTATIIEFTMKGSKYQEGTEKAKGSVDYDGALRIYAVEGDVEYTVAAGSSVDFDELDFEGFYIDATKKSTATLEYITIDDSDLTAGTIYIPGKTTTSVEYDGEKLYVTGKGTTSLKYIEDTSFKAGRLLATGTKIYIPFTAKGNQGLKDGYIEITIGTKAPQFTDLTQSWYKNAVAWACENEITKGTSATKFSPDLGCTRAQAVTFLYRAYLADGNPAFKMTSYADDFKDVDATKHADYYAAIAWAKYYGVTSGTSATTFGPDKVCTRAQIVTFIYNYVSKVEGRSVVTYGANPFKDVKPTGAHKAYADAIQWAVDKGVTSGETSTTFAPDKTCTRAHIVTFLYNYFN